MIKTDSSGNLQWQKINPVFYNALAIFETKDSGYFHGSSRMESSTVRFSGKHTVANKTLSMPISGVQQTSDGDYVFVSANWEHRINGEN